MALAQTAQMLVELNLGGNFTSGIGQAESKLGTFGSNATSAMGKFSTGIQKAGGHLKNLLTGPLGLIGLGGAAFGLERFFSGALEKTSEFSLALEKLTGLTGESAQSMGQLLLLTDKYGIDAGRTAQIVGFAEKTLGLLNSTTAKGTKAQISANLANLEHIKLERESAGLSTTKINKLIAEQKARDALNASNATGVTTETKLMALGKQYGIQLTDSRGKAINFSTELSRVADYYTSNATASDKAALAAKLFGRGYATLIPILQLGSKGIRDQEQAYKDMGLTLGTDTQGALKAYQSALRNVGEAVNILQLQLGLALAPMVTKAANAFSIFLEQGGAKQIVSVFTTLAGAANTAAGFIGDVAGKVMGFWNGIPPELRDVLFKGIVADRTIKFLFGFSPIGSALGALTGGLTKAVGSGLASAGLGKLFVQPVFVTNPGFGAGGGGVPGVAGAAASAAGGIGIGTLVAAIGGSLLATGLIVAGAEIILASSHDLGGIAGRRLTAAARGLNPANVSTSLSARQDPFSNFGKVEIGKLEAIHQAILGQNAPIAAAKNAALLTKANDKLETLRQQMLAKQSQANSRLAQIAAKANTFKATIPIRINVDARHSGTTSSVINTYASGTTGVGGAGYTPGGV